MIGVADSPSLDNLQRAVLEDDDHTLAGFALSLGARQLRLAALGTSSGRTLGHGLQQET